MNFVQNLHLIGFKIRKIPSVFDLVSQPREQAMVSKTRASISVGMHALPPFNFEMAYAPYPHPHPVFQSSRVRALFAG